MLSRDPIPKINFRIYRVSGGEDAYLVVELSAVRKDGVEVCWLVSLHASDTNLLVRAVVEVESDLGFGEVFELSANATDPIEAAELIQS